MNIAMTPAPPEIDRAELWRRAVQSIRAARRTDVEWILARRSSRPNPPQLYI